MARRRRIKPVAIDRASGAPVAPISAGPFVGLCLLAAAFFLYAASVVLAPWWVVLLGLAAWLVLVLMSLRWWAPHPDRLPWLGGLSVVLWALLMIGGGIAFRWHGIWTIR